MAKYEFDNKHTFINPYNFVPNAAKKTTVSEPSKNDQLHTGVLHCRLITKTPIIIPDTAQRQETEKEDHYRYPFMKINGEYAIPGSSIRGPIRSVYETMTNSCYATVREDQIVSNRAVKPFQPGLLRKEESSWKLYEAVRYKLSIDKFSGFLNKLDYGKKVWFTASGEYVTDIYDSEKTGTEEGYLFKGEPFPGKKGKKNESVLVYKDSNQPLSIDDETLGKAVIHLKNLLICYRDQKDSGKLKRFHNGYSHIDPKIFNGENACIPIWYEYEDRNLHLSFAQIGRYTYEKSLNEILGTFDACKKRENCCAACRLFGMAAKEDAAAGKVRFTDAFLEEGGKEDKIDLRELGTPHITYLPFYMENTMDYDDNGARIRGRKYYWHFKLNEQNMALAKAEKPTNLNDTMEYLDQGIFSFDVYYERVTSRQFKELMWVLCMGENSEEGSMCHKIGHAKPLGFGSVKIVINGREERTYSAEEGYIVKELPVDVDEFRNAFKGRTDPDTMRAMLAMADFNTIPAEMQVRYPYVEAVGAADTSKFKDNVLASHKWYSQNYKLGAKNAEYQLASADAGAKALLMPYLKASGFTDGDYVGNKKQNKKNKETQKKSGARQGSNKDNNPQNRHKKALAENKNVEGAGGVYSGRIDNMKTERNFGFIRPDVGDENLYFRRSEAPDFDHMKKGDRVSYQIGTGKNGWPCAVHVERC